jgi:two-component sensor histidine kinase
MFKVIAILFTLSLCVWGSESILSLKEKQTKNFNLLYHIDKTNALDIQAIENIDFKPTTSNYALGYKKGALWFKITLINPTAYEEFILSVNEHFYETAELYYYDTQWQKKQSGFFTPLHQREIQTPKLAFHITIKPNHVQTIYVKLQGKYSYFGNITITPKEQFYVHQFLNIQSFYIFALGIVLMIILFNFFLWIKLKEKIYGLYVGYTFSIFIYLFTMSSFLVYLNIQEFTYKFNISGPLASAFLALFSLELLKVKQYYKKLHYIILLIVGFLFICSFFQFFYYTPWNAIVSKTITLLNITLVITALLIYLKGQLYIKYYAFALMLFFIFVVLFVSMLSGSINYNFLTRYGYIFALCFEVIVFSLMLADRHNSVKNKQLATQKKLLELQKNQKTVLEEEVAKQTNTLSCMVKERELLLKEVFHRVKNNFHMVTAFLWLESKKEGNENRFTELLNRIQSMSLIHEYLCNGDNITHIESKEYFNSLISILTKSYKNIKTTTHIDSFIISFEDIISLSVIVNELISNSVKHNPQTSLQLHIKCCLKKENIVELSFEDNAKKFDIQNIKKGFGLKLIDDFTHKLKEGHGEFYNNKGCLFVLEFKRRENDET